VPLALEPPAVRTSGDLGGTLREIAGFDHEKWGFNMI